MVSLSISGITLLVVAAKLGYGVRFPGLFLSAVLAGAFGGGTVCLWLCSCCSAPRRASLPLLSSPWP